MPFQQEIINQVIAASTPIYASTKAEVVDYYRKEYPRGWQAALSRDLADLTGGNARNINRRFNPDRINQSPRPGSKQAQEYQDLGQQLELTIGYKPPDDGVEITFQGEIKISKKCYPRSFIITIPGEATDNDDLAQLLDDAANGIASYDIIFKEYFDGDEVAEGFCGNPDIVIQPVGAQTVISPAPSRHKSRTAFAKR